MTEQELASLLVPSPPPLTEYEQVSAELGFNNPALQHRRIVCAMTRDEIPVYRLDRVMAHMDRVARKNSSRWREIRCMWLWRPLRQQDAKAGLPCQRLQWEWQHGNGIVTDRPYALPVPVDALKLAARVSRAVPGARLFVTDLIIRENSMRGDPFMAVWGGLEMIPFAVWDEPGF